MNNSVRLEQFCQSLLSSRFLEFLFPHPRTSSPLHGLRFLLSPPFATRIFTPHPAIVSISTEHQSRLQLSPSSHTIVHIFTVIIPTHNHHSYFWNLIFELDITSRYHCSLLISTHTSSLINCLTPTSQVSIISHRLSRLCYSVSFSSSIYTCKSITPAPFSAATLTASHLSFLHYSHSLSLIHTYDQLPL